MLDKADKECARRMKREWYPVLERLHRIGFDVYGWDPGVLVRIRGALNQITYSLDGPVLCVIDEVIKRAYPETADDAKMIREYVRRQRREVAESEKKAREEKRRERLAKTHFECMQCKGFFPNRRAHKMWGGWCVDCAKEVLEGCNRKDAKFLL